jgi:branched-chain amino acid transport system substrate-binding protein
MIVDPDVVGVVGHFSDEVALAAVDAYRRADLALITPAAANAITEPCPEAALLRVEGEGDPEIFRLYADNGLLGVKAARYAVQELGASRLAVLRGRDDLADAFARRAQQLGAEIVLDAKVDLTFDVSRFRLVELIFFTGGAAEGGELIAQLRQAGIEAIFLGGSALDSPLFGQIGGEAVGGTLYITSVPRVELGAGFSTDFVPGYRALAGRLPGSQAVVAHDAACVLLEALHGAIESGGRPTRQAVVAELGAIEDYPGLLGPITFDDRGDLADPQTYIYRFGP